MTGQNGGILMLTAETEAGGECGWAAEGQEEEFKIFSAILSCQGHQI